MSSKNPLVATIDKMVKEGINYMETEPNVVEKAITHHTKKIKLTPKTKQTNHKHLKVKKINLSAMNQTKVYHWINQCNWINQGLLKEMKLKTQ